MPNRPSSNARAIPLLILAAPTVSLAQQAIVNMPSADTTPKGKSFAMHETQWRWWSPGAFWYGTQFYCFGVGRSTELTATVYNAGTPGASNFATGAGFKSSPQIFGRKYPNREIKVTFGQKLVMNHRSQGLGSFSYGHVSFRAPKLKTRLTGGAWAGTKQLFKRDTGDVLAAVEQPLTPGGKIVFVNEWFRGRHDFGFLITGFLFHPTKRHVVVAAYKIPNAPVNGRAGIVLELWIVFLTKCRLGTNGRPSRRVS